MREQSFRRLGNKSQSGKNDTALFHTNEHVTNALCYLVVILIALNIFTLTLINRSADSSSADSFSKSIHGFVEGVVDVEHKAEEKDITSDGTSKGGIIANVGSTKARKSGSSANLLTWVTEDGFVCDNSIEFLFNVTIEKLKYLKSKDYMTSMTCPQKAQTGWRPGTGYIPWVFGTTCEPWWHRDAVYVVEHLLHKNMKALEYGSGASSIWISLHTKYTVAIEQDQNWIDGLVNISSLLGIQNLEIRKFAPGRKYVEIDFDMKPGGMDWRQSLTDNTGIDFISVDGRVRKPCLEYSLKWLKPHGGIILLDNSDRSDDPEGDPANWDGELAKTVVPNHWLKYTSFNYDKHVDNLENKRWLENSQTTVWISRDPRCL